MILELARRSNGRMTVAEPCIQLDDYINGCKTCPPGSTCAKEHSFPVPLAGHCMKDGAPYCFFRCVRPEDCPGGKEHAVCGAGVETDRECAGAGAPGR